MATRYKKVKYICECGTNYGDCGKELTFIQVCFDSTGHSQILQSDHNGTLFFFNGFLNERDEVNLQVLLSKENESASILTEEEFKRIQELRADK